MPYMTEVLSPIKIIRNTIKFPVNVFTDVELL